MQQVRLLKQMAFQPCLFWKKTHTDYDEDNLNSIYYSIYLILKLEVHQ